MIELAKGFYDLLQKEDPDMAFHIDEAKKYVDRIDLSATPMGLMPKGTVEETGDVFDKAKNQATVVGAGLFSFATGVTTEVREAISESALLAQLVANMKDPQHQNPLTWFNAYNEVLQNVGWTLQESGMTNYTTTGMGADVHEQILEIMSIALGPTATTLAIVNGALNSLKAMKTNTPWITIFNRETQIARMARFQVGLVEKEEKSDVFVSLLACLIEAQRDIVQVLFFKWKEDRATFRANTAKVSVNRASLVDLLPVIRNKVRAYELDYLTKAFLVQPQPATLAKRAHKAA